MLAQSPIAGAPIAAQFVAQSSSVTPPASVSASVTLPGVSAFAAVGTIAANISTTVSIRLIDATGQPRPNLGGLRWAFFDQATPDTFAAPVAKGQGATTDAGGNFSATLTGSSLTAGAVGWLIVTDSTGAVSQTPAAKAFSGPVAVS